MVTVENLMLNLLLIFLGGGVGCVLRYLISNGMFILLSDMFGSRNFPYGTLIVNISGSFLMGLLLPITLKHFPLNSAHLGALLLVGFLGGYTTFSSFSIETFTLIETGQIALALLNISLNIILSISLTGLGLLLGRAL
jgi:CrcB protein